ncbi:unnamed protein product [Menidia menidia]|uniref:(Atlantic silverside) hypothetical protein n=1 Tax=Menidia menidia TaxID=238744 RepID=A0A8S4BFC7_9TELE|nr:unnamed protein product [Menidia menidia]
MNAPHPNYNSANRENMLFVNIPPPRALHTKLGTDRCLRSKSSHSRTIQTTISKQILIMSCTAAGKGLLYMTALPVVSSCTEATLLLCSFALFRTCGSKRSCSTIWHQLRLMRVYGGSLHQQRL